MGGLIDSIIKIDWASIAIPSLSILEKIIRPLFIYLFLIIALRVAGKREMAQLNTFDFVVLLLLSNTVQNAIIGNDNSVSGGIIGAISLLVVNFIIAKFLFKHPKIDEAFEGKPDMLIVNGKINRDRLSKELITEAELEIAAHKQGIEFLADIETAEIDPDGELFFVQKTPPPEQARHNEIIKRLEALSKELESLRAEIRGKQN
jgi:uncharacterized membrane protein YcaP (DUF421 family)